jgi:hypothetical protein
MSGRRFFGERVQVVCDRDAAGFHLPARFVFGEKTVEVAEVLRRWQDRGFHPRTPRRSWLERRHRTFYRVRATDGFVYDLYVDRTGGRRDWFVTRRTPSAREHDPSEADGSAPPAQ